MKNLIVAIIVLSLFSCSKSDKNAPKVYVDAQNAITGMPVYNFELSSRICFLGSLYSGGGGCNSNVLDVIYDSNVNKDDFFLGSQDYIQDVYFIKDGFHAKDYYKNLWYDTVGDTIHFSVKPLVNLSLEINIIEPLEYIEVKALEFFQEHWITGPTSSVPLAIQASDILIGSTEVGCIIGETISDNLFLNLPVVAEDSIRLYISYRTEKDRYNQVETLITGKGSSFEATIELTH